MSELTTPGPVASRTNPHVWPYNFECDLRDGSFGYRVQNNNSLVTDAYNRDTIDLVAAGGQSIAGNGDKTGIDARSLSLTQTGVTVAGTATDDYDVWFRFTKV